MKLLLIATIGWTAMSCTLMAFSAPLPSRQVHLDFHTSELIPGIGEKFDRQQWQAALRAGHVNQINIFAKCHHGWSYYPTKVGQTHPNLRFDLLGAQIEACHEMGVKCPIYFTVGWSAHDAETHPEWCAREKNGDIRNGWGANKKSTDIKPGFQWKALCPNPDSPYHAMILRQVEEICRTYPVDGFWFDIYGTVNKGCHCTFCQARMKKEGIDLSDEKAVSRSATLAAKEHMRQLRELIARHHPTATSVFNTSSQVSDSTGFKERLFDMDTQVELEDLPTAWGGYDKLPLNAKYHLGQGSKVVAMSGKFHKAWGEFGGFKHPDAIQYEAAAMIANGVACNFGDQLHPSGEMDVETYRNIGQAYIYVEKIEQYGPGGKPYSKLGLWLTLDKDADNGVVTILLETHHDFVIADEKNLDGLETVIIPSEACLSSVQAETIGARVKRGGKLLVFGAGAMDDEKKRFLLDVGTDYVGASRFSFDYTVVKPPIAAGLVTTPFLNYKPGLLTRLTTGSALAMIREPYFNRTYGQYSGHANTPYKLEDSAFPAVVRNGNIIFLAHALDRLYYTDGVRLHRDLVRNALDLLDPEPALKVTGLPSSGRVSLLHQKAKNRYVAHLLYSPALQRGSVKVIEDFPAIPGVKLEVRVPERVTKARCIPRGETLAFTQEAGLLKVAVPTFRMHAGIVLEYKDTP